MIKIVKQRKNLEHFVYYMFIKIKILHVINKFKKCKKKNIIASKNSLGIKHNRHLGIYSCNLKTKT